MAKRKTSPGPDADATKSASETLSDVNQLDAFGGDRSARAETSGDGRSSADSTSTSTGASMDSHGENLDVTQPVEAGQNDAAIEEDSKYNQ